MPTLVLTTPTNPGFATWTDSTLIPGAGLTVQKAPVVASGIYTLTFAGAGVAVAAGPGANEATVTVGGGGGAAPGGIANSVQINDGVGGFGGDANLLYDGVNLTVGTGGSVIDIGQGFITGGPNLTVETQAGGTLTLGTAGETVDIIGLNILVNSQPGNPGDVLTSNGPGVAPTWQAAGGGGGIPAPPLNSVQFNNAGAFGGDARLTYDSVTNAFAFSDGVNNTLKLTIPAGAATITSEDGAAVPQSLTLVASTTTFASGTAYVLASIGAAPLPAALRVNAVHVVANATVGPIVLPPMLPADDGLRVEIANNVAGPMQVVPPAPGAARAMSAGGGSAWVWVNALATWICTSNV